jgi:hypothetical protein
LLEDEQELSAKGGPTWPRNGLGRLTWADRSGPISAKSAASFARCCFLSLVDPSPFCMWALVVSFSTNWMKLLVPQDSALFDWVLRVCHFFGLGPWALGVVFTSLHDLYRASWSFHKMLDELIPEVLLSTLKPCINTKLQNRHAQTNLLYRGG